jgi:hypothetical protein
MINMKAILKKFFLLLTAAIIFPSLNGQTGVDPLPGADEFNEKLLIATDRELYFAGEQILFEVYKINRLTGMPSSLSRIIYAELLDRSNNPVAQVKLFADGSSGNGKLVVPDTVASGNYVIRAYTKWMLNFPETYFSYKYVTIINPFRKFDGIVQDNKRVSGVRNDTLSLKNAGYSGKATGLNIITDKASYPCRTRVNVDISSSDPVLSLKDADLSVSVIKSILSGPGTGSLGEALSEKSVKMEFMDDTLKLPEPEGETISGTISDRLTNEPLANEAISLSIVGKYSRCRFGHTGPKGEFIFPVSGLYGANDIVIQPMEKHKNGYYVELNESFSSSFIDLPFPDFYLDSAMAEKINKSIISMQVNKQYEASLVKRDYSTDPLWKSEFYGIPDKRLNLSDYIELTNIREVVREILPEVSVTGKDENARFKILYRNPYGKFENPALVLVDGVPFNNIARLLEVPGRLMERIDIINVRYFFSDFIFDGIISFVTKKGNLSDLGYDDTVFRQVFVGSAESMGFYSPSYESDSLRKNHLPDFRNTLFWDPLPKMDTGDKINVEFYTSDEPGDYLIRVEGVTADGKVISVRNSFRVE